METAIIRKVNFLVGYAFVSSVALVVVVILLIIQSGQAKSRDEITLKRLNLVGEDGSLRMVISNETRQHPGRIDGKDLPKRERPPGIIFFNTNGDECGGLVADVSRKDSTINSGMSFTMDNYRNDQVVQILNDETYQNGEAQIRRGFVVNEFPVGTDMASFLKKWEQVQSIPDSVERKEKQARLRQAESSKRRLFAGRNLNDESGLFLYDSNGKLRMKVYVNADGNPKIEFLNPNGTVTRSMEESE